MNRDDRATPGDHPRQDPPTDADLMAAARRGTRTLAQAPDVSHLWDGIARAAFDDDDHDDTPAAGGGVVADTRSPRGLRAVRSRPDRDARSTTRGPSRLVRSPERRRRRTFAGGLVGVAAAVLAVLGVSYVLVQDEPVQPVASFRMDPLDDRVAAGVDGRLVQTDDGQAVEVDLTDLPPAPDGTFYELWLLDVDAGRLVSLGPVDASASYAVPAAVADATWPTIDVSVEPVDGDPTHSSDSVLRGPVVAAGPTD